MQTRKLTIAALFIAIGTLTAHLIYIPAGISRCFPVQHAINVMAAVLLGADYATAIGFVIACLRNMFGTGSLLAFPGSMVGAFLAGILYQRHKTLSMAVAGEIFHRESCHSPRPAAFVWIQILAKIVCPCRTFATSGGMPRRLPLMKRQEP